jgi:dienelactone hydrolase
VIARTFHNWERRLASVDTNRVVRPFEWGLEWIGLDPNAEDIDGRLRAWTERAVSDSAHFYDPGPPPAFDLDGDVLTFPSAIRTPHPENDRVIARLFEARARRGERARRAVLVLPQWNADEQGHAGLCRGLAYFGITALRLSLPYHDRRRPPDLERADYIVSANVGRTLEVNRQAVLDARRSIDWLAAQGYDRIGILGTSLGSCLSLLTMAHDERVRVGAFNHVSPYFADVVWRGLSTSHVRAGFNGQVTLDQLRDYWMPISPWPFIDRLRGRQTLLIYARFDLTFPPDLSRKIIGEFKHRGVEHSVAVLPCGHYTTGKAPFKFLDGYELTKFFVKRL